MPSDQLVRCVLPRARACVCVCEDEAWPGGRFKPLRRDSTGLRLLSLAWHASGLPALMLCLGSEPFIIVIFLANLSPAVLRHLEKECNLCSSPEVSECNDWPAIVSSQ